MKKSIDIIFVLFLVFLVCLMAGLLCNKPFNMVYLTNNSTLVNNKTSNISYDLRMKYTEWVFKHSRYISFRQAKQIVDESMKYPYPELLLAIFAKESSFNPCAVSHVGAIGLGQILPTKERLKQLKIKKRDLFNIDVNVRATNLVIREKLRYSNGNLRVALEKYLGKKDKKYVDDVLSNLGDLFLLKNEVFIVKRQTHLISISKGGLLLDES